MGEWLQVADGNPHVLQLFRRHYSYNRRRDQLTFIPSRERNRGLFVGPGEKMVLLSDDGRAMFIWRKFISADGQTGVNCAAFRNEGSGLSSELIQKAVELARLRWPGERFFTYVNAAKVRSRNPGFCFLQAGWVRCGRTKARDLLILEMLPCADSANAAAPNQRDTSAEER